MAELRSLVITANGHGFVKFSVKTIVMAIYMNTYITMMNRNIWPTTL